MSIIISGKVTLNEGQIIAFTTTAPLGPFRYFRLNITDFYTGNIVKVGDFRLTESGQDYPTSGQNMTSNTAPAPLVASASSDDGAGLEPFRGFDGSLATRWRNDGAGPPDWLKIDLGAGNEIAPTSAKITNGNSAFQSPGDFTIEGSNDDSNWVILTTVTGETWSTTEQTKTFNF